MIHPTADVSPEATIGSKTRVWHRTQIGAGVSIGEECIVGSNVYIDREVSIGNRVKIQTGVQIYHGVTIEDGVFVGPMACLTNDKYPRAVNPDGTLKTDTDWEVGRIHVGYGAALGAGSIILPNVIVGRFALVGAGALVVRNVPDHGIVVGTPARLVGYACACGRMLERGDAEPGLWKCAKCRREYVELENGGLRARRASS